MLMQSRPNIHELELERVRLLHDTAFLRHFVLRSITWELLMVIYHLEGVGSYGINDYIDQLKTMRTTRLTIQNFIKHRIQEGSLIVIESNKKSRKTLALSPGLKQELEQYFSWLNGQGLSSQRLN